MPPRGKYRKIERTPEQLAELRAVREYYQREKPTLEEVLAKGGGPVTTMGEVMAIMQLAHSLRKERERLGLSLQEVAGKADIDAPALSRIETGKNSNPTFATLAKIAQALGKVLGVELREPGPSGTAAQVLPRGKEAKVLRKPHSAQAKVTDLEVRAGKPKKKRAQQPKGE